MSHILVGLCVDVSSSMGMPHPGGKPIDLLNDGLKTFFDHVNAQCAHRGTTHVIVVPFGTTVLRKQVRPFTIVKDNPHPPSLKPMTEPGTNIPEAILFTLEAIKTREHECSQDMGVAIDWLLFVLLTDGHGSSKFRPDLDQAVLSLRKWVQASGGPYGPRAVPMIVGVGSNVGPDLNAFDKPVSIKNWDYKDFFQNLSSSLDFLRRSVNLNRNEEFVREDFGRDLDQRLNVSRIVKKVSPKPTDRM